MATQAIFQERRGELNQLVRGWDRRLRVQQAFTWLPRCIAPALAIGIALAIISRVSPFLVSGQVVLVTGILLALGFVGMVLAVWFWPRTHIASARRFDVLFGLQERVSTALELIDGRIHADEELVALQVNDAWTTAQTVRAGESLPLKWRGREWGGILLLALVLVILLVIPNPQEQKIAQDTAVKAAIDAAADELRQITEDVASDASLEPEDRDELLQALETSQNTLQKENVTPEEAFASLSEAEAALQEKADSLNDQSNAGQAGLQAASDALRNFQPPQEQPQEGAAGAQAALNNLSQNIPNLSQEQQQDMANSLSEAAETLQESNPNASQALQQASQSLQQGNPTGAQEALNQASSGIQQAAQQQQSQQSSAQQLSQSAQNVQESADQVSQQSQQGQQSGQNQEGQQGQPNQQGQDQQGQQQGQQPDQQGEQGQQQGQQGQPNQDQQGQQQGQANQPGQSNQQGEGQQGQGGQPQSGQQGQSGNQPGQQGEGGQSSQQGSQGQSGQSQASEGSGGQQAGEQSPSGSSATGSGAGDGTGDAGQSGQGSQDQAGQVSQDNNPDGQGQGQFDPVYAPQRVGGEGGEQIQLNADASNSPLQEGDFAQNPDGNVTVPYDQVFSDYSDAANRALESDYIPLGLRDVVRDYFSSLEPGQSSGNNGNQGGG